MHSEFKASVGYMNPCLTQEKREFWCEDHLERELLCLKAEYG